MLNTDKTINDYIIDCLKKINDSGHFIAIITNKNYNNFENIIEPINEYINFFITNNGSVLIDKVKNETLKTQKTLNIEFVHNILRDVQLLGGILQIIAIKKIIINPCVSGLKNQKWLTKEIKEEYIEPFVTYNKENIRLEEIIQLTILLNPNLVSELTIFMKNFYGRDYEFSSSTPWSIDINAAGITKYEGVKALILFYKIKVENVFCFLHSNNDLDLATNIINSYTVDESDELTKATSKKVLKIKSFSEINLEIKKILKK